MCERLFTCCDGASVERFFAAFKASEGADGDLYAAYQSQIPPSAELTAEACPALLTSLYEAGPWGAWVTAAQAGQVTFVQAEADACVASVTGAACGEAVAAALGPASCLSIAPPEPGVQRTIFTRSATVGDTCAPLRDGFGGLYYGTCDPTQAFCCQLADGQCTVPSATGTGRCVAASSVGEACNYFGDLTLCQTGLDCNPDTGLCDVLETPPDVLTGDACFDNNTFAVLGNCVDSWCDLFGDGRCHDQLADGGACETPDQCIGGACNGGVCGVDTFCAAQ